MQIIKPSDSEYGSEYVSPEELSALERKINDTIKRSKRGLTVRVLLGSVRHSNGHRFTDMYSVAAIDRAVGECCKAGWSAWIEDDGSDLFLVMISAGTAAAEQAPDSTGGEA